jgi:glycosyltransferase involved in cell wall biosynthesis
MAPRLTLCLIAKDVELLLPGCLASVKGVVDEIVLVDTGSTDRTVAIAREAGAKVLFRPWDDDFAAPRNLAAGEATGDWILQLDPDEELLLASVERPIVLVRQRPGGGLAPEVAPGNPLVGLLLAYTPLHHLLLEAAGRPLVMTSGNLSEEPMAAGDQEALERLSGIADLFLVHDRPITTRTDVQLQQASIKARAPI